MLITSEKDWEKMIRKRIKEKFGTFKAPQCMHCKKTVQANGYDVDIHNELITFWVECHNEREEIPLRFEEIFNADALEIKHAFHPMSDAVKSVPKMIRSIH